MAHDLGVGTISGDGNDAVRLALAMIRSDWQDDPAAWHELYAVSDDPEAVARELTHLCRQTLDQLATVAGISSGEMLHRLASRLVPYPHAGPGTPIDVAARERMARTSP